VAFGTCALQTAYYQGSSHVPYMDIMFVASLSTRNTPPRRGGMLAESVNSHGISFCERIRCQDHNLFLLNILVAGFE
jgi:hypothetical protein